MVDGVNRANQRMRMVVKELEVDGATSTYLTDQASDGDGR